MSVLVDGELVLYGFVGDSFWGDGFTASEVIDALAELGRDADVTVRLNSGGGYTDDGIAIFNTLTAHRGKVEIVVDAMAASAASVIAMAGDTVTMGTGALMMIHDPSRITYGDAAAHDKSTEQLNKLADLMADIYAERSGGKAAEIREEMKAELWLTGAEAVARGFATDSGSLAEATVSAFDYSVYAAAPDRLVAMSTEHQWSLEKAMARKAAATTQPRNPKKEAPMANKPTAPGGGTAPAPAAPAPSVAANTEERTRIRAITGDAAAAGQEELARHLAFETDMTAEDAIATLAAAAKGKPDPANPAPDPTAYQQQRSAASLLAPPVAGDTGKPAAKTINTTAIYDAMRGGNGA